MTERHYTYQEVWDKYAAGELSTVVLRILLKNDEVFRKWCERKAQAEKRRIELEQQVSDEDMA